MKRLKENIELYIKDLKEEKNPCLIDYYKKSIEKSQKIIDLIEKYQFTPEIFDELSDRDKWDLYDYLDNKVNWCCGYCKTPNRARSPGFGIILCENCNEILSYRTNGGQSNQFNWSFQWNEKEARRQKLFKLNK